MKNFNIKKINFKQLKARWYKVYLSYKKKLLAFYQKNKSMLSKGGAATVIVALLVAIGTLDSKVRDAGSNRKLNKLLRKTPHAMVLFYEKDRKALRDNKSMSKKIASLESVFNTISERRRYKEGDLTFIKINVAREKSREIADEYNVKQLPTFMLFNYGEPMNGVLTGWVKGKKVESFIESNLKASIEKVIEEKEEDRERRLEEAQIRSYYTPYFGYPYFGWGWGGPYWRSYGHYRYW